MDVDPDQLDAARRLLAGVDPAAYYRSMAGLARADHSSLLQPLEFDPTLGGHDPNCVMVEPNPSGWQTTHMYARAAFRDFDSVLASAFSAPELDHLLAEVYHRVVVDHRNVALVTNHGDIVDIALVLAALVLAIGERDRSFGVLGERIDHNAFAQHANVMVSRMVATRQTFSVPAIEVLQSMCRVWLSVPQTANRRRAKLEVDLVRANNLVMRHELNEVLVEGGQLLAMAASGSQDLSLAANLAQRVRATWRQRRGVEPGGGPSLHLQPLYDGTIACMLTCEYVLPVAIALGSNRPACVIGGLTRVREPADCHGVMEWIAAAHEERTGISTIYHHHEDPLLVQIRDVLRS